ncbi:MAG: hypothetical protein K9H25_01745 [Rhodospirillum sp.]|nr:hypothetical protein [Rhodospirillum sp.]MCF8487850.1 hypothetical protein [Rhodospirillum sp.]MCF8503255.1 hypothetical protein [Rhodospirillum sp.]
MFPILLPYLIPLGLAMAGVGASILAGALTGHRAGGERLAGVGIGLGTVAGWLWIRWLPQTIQPLDWAIFGAFAAALVGMLVDGLDPKPRVALTASALAAVALAWGVAVVIASATGLGPTQALIAWGLGGLYWLALLWRMARRGGDPTAGLAGLVGLYLGLAGVAWAVDAWVARDLALAALCALSGWLVWTLLARIPFSQTARLAASGLAVCLGMGLALTEPAALPGLAVVALVPLADGTAARIPLPKGRMGSLLRPLVVGGLALLPLPIAVAMALVSAGMPAS